jgi:hypothetical protein
MRIIDGKHVVLFGQDWSQDELMRFAQSHDCSLLRHETGAIEIVRNKDKKKVVPIKKERATGKVVDFLAVRAMVSQPTPKSLLKERFRFTIPDHEPTPPGAA